MDNRPIGIFDSGLGGLTGLMALRALLPEEDLIYFGDTGRMPYGGRPTGQLRRMAAQNLAFMAGLGVKAVFVACGTFSSTASDLLESFPTPSFGVLRAGADALARVPGDGPLAVLATKASIDSGAFTRALRERCPGREILPVACPRFVPLIESGHSGREDPLVRAAVAKYLAPLRGADAVLLGCTHYGIVEGALRRFLPEETLLVSASACGAAAIRDLLDREGLRGGSGEEKYLVSGDPEAFQEAASLLLGRSIAGLVRSVPVMRIEL